MNDCKSFKPSIDNTDLLETYDCYKMPSTSPANAKFSLDKLFEEWEAGIKYF